MAPSGNIFHYQYFFHFFFSRLLSIIALWCPNISSLSLKVVSLRSNYFCEFQWFSSIADFKNLEKLEMDVYLRQVLRQYHFSDEYIDYQEMIQKFLENPMTKMKELKFDCINAIFQDNFLIHLNEIFPNLETFNLTELGDQGYSATSGFHEEDPSKYSYWRFDHILEVLQNLGSVKNLTLPTMGMVLASWNDVDEQHQNIRETGRVFHEALQIIKNQFPLALGDLKIIDKKYGYVILKEKMKKPKMFNQMTANDRPVREMTYSKDTKKVYLKLKPKRKQKGTKENSDNVEEIVLSKELIKTLSKMCDEESY